MAYSLFDPATLPSAQDALGQATRYQGLMGSALGRASGYTSRMAGTAGQLRGQGSQLYDQYWGNFAGLLNQLPGMANIPLNTYVNEAANAVGSNYDRERGIMSRNLGRMGVNPNSGRWQGLMGQLARSEAAARAGAMTTARNTGRMENFQRSLQAGGMGLQIAGMGTGALGAAGGLYGSAASQAMGLGSVYGGLSNAAGQYAGYLSGLNQPQQGLVASAPTPTQGTTATPNPRPVSDAEWYGTYQPYIDELFDPAPMSY